MAKKTIAVSTSPVTVVAGAACLSVALSQAIGESPMVAFKVYDANQNLLATVPPGGGYEWNTGTGSIFTNGQTVGYVAVYSGTSHFQVQDQSIQPVSITVPNVVALSADGAIPVATGLYAITKATAGAFTLAAPVPGNAAQGGDDGKLLRIVSTTAAAHVITTPANKIDAADDTATFAATIGKSITLEAYNGIWYSRGSASGVTLTEV